MIAILAAALLTQSAVPATSPAAARAPEIHCRGNERNLQTYLEMTRVLFNGLQGERAADFYASEFISHNDDQGGDRPQTYHPEVLGKMWAYLSKVEKNRYLINNLIICRDDLVMAQVTLGGTYVGPGMQGNPPEGRRYEQSGIDIYRFNKDRKVIERWGNSEGIAKIRQLGLTPDLSLKPLQKD